MDYLTTIGGNIYEIAQQTTDEATKQQLMNLWKNNCHRKRAEEAIHCGAALHGEDVIKESQRELNKLTSAKNLFEKVILG
tara:strand:- start:311 stop:550 length:240 start_codon:yes stop_codon:yes gene_type:complete